MLSRLKSIIAQNNYLLYTQPYELNIVGVRAPSVIPNRFDDEMHVFYKTGPISWDYHVFNITTDPGTYWLANPMMEQGTAILAQGQYKNAYTIGLHKGEYTALVQAAPVTVIRDYNRNAVLDFMNGTRHSGNFGINIHRASLNGITKYVDRYSAGCQVFENIADFNVFMGLCQQHRNRYGNKFTYTLIDHRAVRRETVKRVAVGATLLGAGVTTYLYFNA